ncbi:MAG: hypothetical protein QOE90_2453 [Thermoplasmata archaeon]|nr:hypothetical protein [Thermoplasmata archaeon]
MASVMKKVRVTPQEARTLARLAKRQRKTESQVLREALARADLLQRRAEAVEKLIAMIEDPKPKRVPWGLR